MENMEDGPHGGCGLIGCGFFILLVCLGIGSCTYLCKPSKAEIREIVRETIKESK